MEQFKSFLSKNSLIYDPSKCYSIFLKKHFEVFKESEVFFKKKKLITMPESKYSIVFLNIRDIEDLIVFYKYARITKLLFIYTNLSTKILLNGNVLARTNVFVINPQMLKQDMLDLMKMQINAVDYYD